MTQEQIDLIAQLAEHHGAHMVQLTYRRTGDEQQAQDIVQETFLTACCRAEVLAAHVNPAGWLYQVLTFLTRRKQEKYKRELHCEAPPAVFPSPESSLPLECYLPNTLSPQDRELLVMRLQDDLSYQEIAERRGITEAACRQQMSRAKRRCRDALLKEK